MKKKITFAQRENSVNGAPAPLPSPFSTEFGPRVPKNGTFSKISDAVCQRKIQ